MKTIQKRGRSVITGTETLDWHWTRMRSLVEMKKT
jgi:hypothetical protein